MTVRTLALCTLALFLPADRADDLSYKPDTETEWSLSFEETSSFELESMIQTVGGTEITGPQPEMTGLISRRLQVRDQGLKVEDGRMLKRSRTLEEIESDCKLDVAVMNEEVTFEISFESELAGQELAVSWDEDAEEHEFEFASKDSPKDSLLEGLLEDLDFQFLLPPDDVEEGDSWEIDLDAARALFSPGGNLHLVPTDAPQVSGNIIEAHDLVAIASMSVAEASQTIDGELRATWRETVEDGDDKVAVIALQLEATFEADVSDAVQEMAAAVDIPPRDDYSFICNWEIEGKGQLSWNLSANHFSALELELEDMVEISLSFSESFGDIVVEVETSGTTTLSATATN